jgi:hypothetical protein
MRRLLVLLLVGCSLVAASARADGDPASDYLYGGKVFLPYDAKIPKSAQDDFTALIDSANRAGYTIRVAVIWSPYDLGSVGSLWRKPREYARFLDAELQFVYKHRLLIVMPSGFGFAWPGHRPDQEYALLAKIPIQHSAAGLVDAASTAVKRLAASAGVKVKAPTKTAAAKPSSHNLAHDRIVIILAAIAAFAIAVLLRLALRRR